MRRRLRTSSTNTSSESFLPYSPIQSVGASLLISFLLLNISMRKLSRDMHVQRESCQRSVNFNKRVVNFFSKLQQKSCQFFLETSTTKLSKIPISTRELSKGNEKSTSFGAFLNLCCRYFNDWSCISTTRVVNRHVQGLIRIRERRGSNPRSPA